MKAELFYRDNNNIYKKLVSRDIVSYTVSSSSKEPFVSCEIELITKETDFLAYEIKVYYNENIIFSGLIDKQDIFLKKTGSILRIKSRSKIGALIFDNEAKPALYENINILELVTDNLNQYGIKTVDSHDIRRIPSFSAGVGESVWGVVVRFCKNIYGITPYIEGEKIIIKKREREDIIFLSNHEIGGNSFNYSEIKHLKSPKRIISSVTTLDENNTEKVFLNDGVENITRKKYISKAYGWSLFPRWSARKILEESKKASEQLIIEIPEIIEVEIGDRVIFEGDEGRRWSVDLIKKSIFKKATTYLELYLEVL